MVAGYRNYMVITEAACIRRIMQVILKAVIIPDVFIYPPLCSDPKVTVSIFKKDRIIIVTLIRITVTGNGSWRSTVGIIRMECFTKRIKTVKACLLYTSPSPRD